MRRLAPWQWLLLLLGLYVALVEGFRLWLGLVWAERVALLLLALTLWAFIRVRGCGGAIKPIPFRDGIHGLPHVRPWRT